MHRTRERVDYTFKFNYSHNSCFHLTGEDNDKKDEREERERERAKEGGRKEEREKESEREREIRYGLRLTLKRSDRFGLFIFLPNPLC